MPVASHDLAALGIGRETSGPTLVHRVTDVVVEGHDDRRVTGDPAHGVGADQPVTLELAG